MCGLSWEDIDFAHTRLHVRHARLDEPGGVRIGQTKTRRRVRTLEMPERVARVTAKAGIGDWQPRELRHCTVSLLSAAGVPLEQVADVTGHSTTRMTGEVYRHSVRPAVETARLTMDRLFAADTDQDAATDSSTTPA
ncbi:MAG: site-specific integrase [Acidimicrobiales bacterium]